MKHINTTNVLILVSGGIDSSACIQFYKDLNFNIEALFIDYKQPARANEYKSSINICRFYNIPLKKIKISNIDDLETGYIIGRNALLYFSGLLNFNKKSGLIASGIHGGTAYYDCSNSFLNNIQNLFDGYTLGSIKATAPFLKFNKKSIVQYCIEKQVPLNLTYSCEQGSTNNNCGNCNTCKDLNKIYER